MKGRIMKTVTIEKESLLKRLINKIKSTALGNIFLNSDSGMTVDSDELDPETRINILANGSDTTTIEEMKEIDKAFKAAQEAADKKAPKDPVIKKESSNPFHVDEADLIHDNEPAVTHSRDEGRERDD